jgi:MFS family permease
MAGPAARFGLLTAGIDIPRRSGVFYGWTIVGTVFVILMVTSGLGFYNASVILAAATDELDVSVGAVSGATALFFAVSGTTGFVLARQMDALDLRLFYLAGGLFGAGSLYSLRWVDNVVELYAFFALFGVGFALAGLVPGTTLVTRWFQRRRSIALSIASTGLSLGGIALTPLAAWLIDQRSLAGAGPILAALWLVGVLPIGVLLVRSRPADKGLEPDGALQVPAADRVPSLPAGASFAAARQTRFFWMMCGAYALIFFAQVGGIAHLFNLVLERAGKPAASTAVSLLAATSVAGRLLGGVVVLRVSSRTLSAALTLLQGAALVAFANSFSAPAVFASAIFLGISVGNLLMLQPLLLAEAFGVAEYSRIYSFNQMFGTIGLAAGPVMLGVVRDALDYRAAFVLAAAASVLGFCALAATGSVDRALRTWDPAPAPVPATTSS